ncbi:hypothetical protein D3C72_1684550 [compost metagenome]
MTSSGMSSPCLTSAPLATASLLVTVAGRRPRSAPRVSSSVRAMTLLLRLLIWRITSASVGESCEASTTASAGTMPDLTCPLKVPPSSFHSRRKISVAYSGCDKARRYRLNSPHEPATLPPRRIVTPCWVISGSVVTIGGPGQRMSLHSTLPSSFRPGRGGSISGTHLCAAGSGVNSRRCAPKPTISASGLAL